MKHFNNITFYGFTIVELLVAMVLLIIILSFLIPEVTYGPAPPRVDPQKEAIRKINEAIDQYYVENGRYPKNLIDLIQTGHPYFSEVPNDPLTGAADWEVAEKDNKNIWYRTSDKTYLNAPPQWNPGIESYVYHIKPRSR
jgi:type II secretory pathway pseudopilin PulG